MGLLKTQQERFVVFLGNSRKENRGFSLLSLSSLSGKDTPLLFVNIHLKGVLGQERSHATGQSHGQSQATQSNEPTNCPKPTKTQVGLMTKQSTNPTNVHTVMTPMPQPVGSWHMTGMTGQMNSTMSHNKLHDQTHKTID